MIYLLAAVLFFSSLNASEMIKGETKTAYGYPMSTWALLDDEHKVKEVGFDFYLGTIENAPIGTSFESEPPFVLDFPSVVKQTTFINHLEFNWRTGGHPPLPYEVAHTDMHFYTLSPKEVSSIDCTNTKPPKPGEIPPGYALLEHCEKAMGYHAFDVMKRKNLHQPFTKEVILGYYDGKLIFVEAMASKEFLLSKKDFSLSIPVPTTIHKTLWPTKVTAKYEKNENMFRISLTDLKWLD